MSAPASAPASRRLTTFDALRGLSVFAMIQQHVGAWLWIGPKPGETVYDYPGLLAFNAGPAIGLPLFFVLSGVGTAMLCQTADERGLDGVLVRRGLMLYAFGLLVNLLTPSWFSWGSFFALHLMGVGIAAAPLWRRMSERGLLVVVAAVLLATPLVQYWLETPEYLVVDRMQDVSLPGGALRLALAEGQYPLLPWLATYVLGFWAGRVLARGALRPLLVVGAVMVAFGGIGHAAVWLTDAQEPDLLWRAFRLVVGWFPAAISIVTLLTGPVLWILAAAARRDARRPLPNDHALVTLGRTSLTVFIIHAPLFRELSRPLGMWSALEPGPTLAVIAAFTIACILFSRWWARYDYRGGAEWLMRRFADRGLRRRPAPP